MGEGFLCIAVDRLTNGDGVLIDKGCYDGSDEVLILAVRNRRRQLVFRGFSSEENFSLNGEGFACPSVPYISKPLRFSNKYFLFPFNYKASSHFTAHTPIIYESQYVLLEKPIIKYK